MADDEDREEGCVYCGAPAEQKIDPADGFVYLRICGPCVAQIAEYDAMCGDDEPSWARK